ARSFLDPFAKRFHQTSHGIPLFSMVKHSIAHVLRSNRLHRYDPKRMHLAAFVDRHILADDEFFVGEAISPFVVFIAVDVVMKSPCTARTMNQMAYIFVVRPKTDDAAIGSVLLPQLGIDFSRFVERRDEYVTVATAAR